MVGDGLLVGKAGHDQDFDLHAFTIARLRAARKPKGPRSPGRYGALPFIRNGKDAPAGGRGVRSHTGPMTCPTRFRGARHHRWGIAGISRPRAPATAVGWHAGTPHATQPRGHAW
ncbi:hypothetical protein GCM10010251_59570 [Streptomyces aurantiogriseus]|uniref:Uncharacterized protein n=1 Tax=Streptomyces aurantiogriseus TaxID=66870 RepID=A0A918KVA5_9ACTN|nr:hypothetical protein GCM10010251_59570 [Streptomyces aurantiogriseus]